MLEGSFCNVVGCLRHDHSEEGRKPDAVREREQILFWLQHTSESWTCWADCIARGDHWTSLHEPPLEDRSGRTGRMIESAFWHAERGKVCLLVVPVERDVFLLAKRCRDYEGSRDWFCLGVTEKRFHGMVELFFHDLKVPMYICTASGRDEAMWDLVGTYADLVEIFLDHSVVERRMR